MSKLQNLSERRTDLRMILDLPHACESIAFHFWYRHTCVVMHVLFTMWLKLWLTFSCWWCFSSKGRLSLPVFSVCNEGKARRHGYMISGEPCARTSFRPWSCTCHARGWENIGALKLDGNVLQSSNLESCFVDACENGSVVKEECVTRSGAFFREKTMTKTDAFVVTWNSRSVNLFSNGETSHKDWNPFKTAGENVSSTTKRQISGIRREQLNELSI